MVWKLKKEWKYLKYGKTKQNKNENEKKYKNRRKKKQKKNTIHTQKTYKCIYNKL